jgi:anti-anti-sigma regulatory factor
MRMSASGNLVVENPIPGVRVLRFARADLRQYLDDAADAPTSPLFREILSTALSNPAEGSVLIINIGLIDPINAAFYRCLLCIRERVQASHSQMVMCGLSPRHQEVFDLLRGPQVFTIARNETNALRLARRWLSEQATPRVVGSSAPLPRPTSNKVAKLGLEPTHLLGARF